MTRVLLDNNQWNFLVAPDGRNGLDMEDLYARVDNGSLQLVGSLDLLQELIGAARRYEDKFEDMVDTFFDMIGPRLLLPLSIRHAAEAVTGGLLPESQRYLVSRRLDELQALTLDRYSVLAVDEDCYLEKEAFRRQEQTDREEVRRRLSAANERLTLASATAWFRTLDLDEWLLPTVEHGCDLGFYDRACVITGGGYARYPSAFAFTAARLAKITYTIGGNRRIQSSDLADAHHLASGPYVDVIVSDDQGLIDVYRLLSRLVPFRVMTSMEFADAYGVLRGWT